MIIISAFICDLDIFFSKFAKQNNHRNLITHSVIPSVVILVLGFILSWPALIVSGIAYFSHVTIDLFDWGTNFFYFPQKTFGPRFFIRNEEKNLSEYLKNYKNPQSYFDFKYYNSKLSLFIEALIFLFMFLTAILFSFEFILICFFYFFGLNFHLSRHYKLKKIESSK